MTFADAASDQGTASDPPRPRGGHLERSVAALPLGIGTRLGPVFAGEGLKAKAMRGSAWTMAGYGAQQVLRLGSNLILTRLLFPEAFGLMALVNVVLQGLQMMSDTGVNASIIQHKRGDDPDFLNTAWTVQIIRGLILWLMACGLAWPVAAFYDQPQLLYMLPVSGLAVVITGFQTTALAQHNRNLKLGMMTSLEIGAQVINLILTITLAWHLQSVWALVIGGVTGVAAKTVVQFLLLPGVKHRLLINAEHLTDIFHFGKWLLLCSAIAFAGQAVDRLALGTIMSAEFLGKYSIALFLAMAGAMALTKIGGQIVFPAIAKVGRDRPADCRAVLLRFRKRLIPLFALLFGFLMFFGEELIGILYDDRYREAGYILEILSIRFLGASIAFGYAQSVLALGDSRARFVITLAAGVSAIVIPLAGYSFAGLDGFLAGLAIAGWCSYPINTVYARKHHISHFAFDATMVGLSTIAIILWVFFNSAAT